MKTMTGKMLTLAGTAVLLLTGSLALAQDQNPADSGQPTASQAPRRGRRAMDPNVQAQHMAKKLKLTADQQSQVAAILTAQRDQATGLRSDTSLSKQDRLAKMLLIRDENESKIRAVLTDEQKQGFDQMLQQRREKLQNRKG